ncbi:MAG TPA: hypothetical protein VK363_11980 [Pyrinomonadaceae bacterium]|nr:hypothetical protein [Pyrinomonadaceae bacterium]
MEGYLILSRLQNLKLTFLAAALLVSFLTLCVVGIVSSTAQSTQDDAEDERKFENTIPAHVPLKVKVKNEQSFKNMKNKNWARELEIEVKNTGNKPIYFMYMVIYLPDMIVNGNPAGFQVTYGRKELVRLTTLIEADDVPIQPGETATLRISEAQVRGFEKLIDEEKRVPPKKVEFDLQLINFGDGTGLRSKQGRPHPDPNKKRASNVPYTKKGDQAGLPTSKAQTSNSFNEFSSYS